MCRRIKFQVPRTLLRLGIDELELLLVKGLSKKVSHADIIDIVVKRGYLSKRGANAVAKVVTDADLKEFNQILDDLCEHFTKYDKLVIRTDHLTGNCNIKKLGAK